MPVDLSASHHSLQNIARSADKATSVTPPRSVGLGKRRCAQSDVSSDAAQRGSSTVTLAASPDHHHRSRMISEAKAYRATRAGALDGRTLFKSAVEWT